MGNKNKKHNPSTTSPLVPSDRERIKESFISKYGSAAGVAALLVYIWQDHSSQFTKLQDKLTQKSEAVERIDERTKDWGERIKSVESKILVLEKLNSGEYRAQAKAAGFTNDAKIIPVNLTSNAPIHATSDAPKVTTSGTPNVQYALSFSDLRYDQNSKRLTFTVGGKVGELVLRGNHVSIILQPGKFQNLLRDFNADGLPSIFIQVLDVPTPNQAILAVGTKPESKESRS
ncbi:hypothetical protein [Candidatus Nitrospira nitrosa]|uniref:hypothetical protein n=1 Tax=Candidatus Nitrospira nitrosa TaxID=1742972 RepID=UPI0011472F1C|nr:hypothetical protein [Candidatus Nitrospira nitrosa]